MNRSSALTQDLETCSVRRMRREKLRSGKLTNKFYTDYLLSHPSTQASSVPVIPLPTFWEVLMDGLGPIWPATRTQIDGISIGDAWPCSSMPSDPRNPCANIVPFHKLTQWLCYSLMVPMTKLMHVHFAGLGPPAEFIGTLLLSGLRNIMTVQSWTHQDRTEQKNRTE